MTQSPPDTQGRANAACVTVADIIRNSAKSVNADYLSYAIEWGTREVQAPDRKRTTAGPQSGRNPAPQRMEPPARNGW